MNFAAVYDKYLRLETSFRNAWAATGRSAATMIVGRRRYQWRNSDGIRS